MSRLIGDGNPLSQTDCHTCEGEGVTNNCTCPDCGGSGYDREEDRRAVASMHTLYTKEMEAEDDFIGSDPFDRLA